MTDIRSFLEKKKLNSEIRITNLFVLLLIVLFFTSCGTPKEKEVTVSNVEISGIIKDFVKVVDGNYKFTNNGKEAFITIQFELVEQPYQMLCRKKHPEEIRINPIDKDGSVFNTGVYGFSASRTEMSKLKDLLNDGKVGDKKRISFEWRYFGQNKEIGASIFKQSNTFEVIDESFNFCGKLNDSDLHWDDKGSGYVEINEPTILYATVNTNGNFPDNLLRMRSTPQADATNNNFVISVPKGETVEILEKNVKQDNINGVSGYWVKIRYSGKGYDKSAKDYSNSTWEGYAWEKFLLINSEENNNNNTSKDNKGNNIDEMLDSYEKIVNQYIAILKKYKAGDMSVLNEYTKFTQEYASYSQKMSNVEGQFTATQTKRFLDINNKYQKALIDLAQ